MTPADAWMLADPCACPVCGRDSCEDHLLPDATPAPPPTTPRLRAIPARELLVASRPEEIVERVVLAGRLSVLVSESGAGKTFVLLDLSAAVSTGVRWHQRETQQGSVVYLSFEGDAFGPRLRALREHAGHPLEHLYIVPASDPISPCVTRTGEEPSVGEHAVRTALTTLATELAAAGRPPIVLLVVDTVRASMTGSEDSSEHVSAYLRAIRRLLKAVPGAGGILAHHAGWQDGETQKKRERGSSAWRGNCDVTLYLEAGHYDSDRREAPLTLRALKVRDSERPAPLCLIRRRVELAETDGHGQVVTSCVIESDQRSRADREAEEAQAANAAERKIDLQVLGVLAKSPEQMTSQASIRVAVNLKRDLVCAALARLIEHGWITTPERQRRPYGVTQSGQVALSEAATL